MEGIKMHIASKLELPLSEAEIVSLIEILESALDGELTENASQFARIVLSYFDDDLTETVQ